MSGSKYQEKHNDATVQTEQNLKMLFLVGVSVPAAHKLAGTSCSCHILASCFCSASFSATALRLAVSYYISLLETIQAPRLNPNKCGSLAR